MESKINKQTQAHRHTEQTGGCQRQGVKSGRNGEGYQKHKLPVIK